MRRPAAFLAAFLVVADIAWGNAGANGASPSGACAAPHAAEFDFWIGSYAVRNARGVLEGRDVVRKTYEGCVVEEHFRAADGSSYGTGFAFYDSSDGRWHYTWVDTIGAFERFAGERRGASMVMTQPTRSSDGRPMIARMTWTPLGRGAVRQLWEASFDGGHRWRIISDVYDRPVARRHPQRCSCQ